MNLEHYVYALLDPRNDEIFYIGKGQGSRVLAHENAAKLGSVTSAKEQRIMSILNDGLEVRNIILAKSFKTHDEAIAIESLMILLARSEKEVLGIKCVLTNEVAGHHSNRFRPANKTKEIAGFEFEAPTRLPREVKESNKALFESVLANIDVFKSPNKIGGAYIRGQTLNNGFEFVVFPKSEHNLVFEYIKRRPTEIDRKHANKVRETLVLDGHYKDARVDYKDKSINVFTVGAAIDALNRFILLVCENDDTLVIPELH